MSISIKKLSDDVFEVTVVKFMFAKNNSKLIGKTYRNAEQYMSSVCWYMPTDSFLRQ